MKISSIERDPGATEAGTWVNEIPQMGDLALKVRGWTSPLVLETRNRKERAVPKEGRNRDGTLTIEAQRKVNSEAMHEVVILDWSGIEDDSGEPVPFTTEQCKAWCLDPRYRQFVDAGIYAANVAENMTAEDRAAAGKNSRK
jgi:hypothetical protein